MRTTELLGIATALCPDKEAIVFEGKRYTYSQTMERVNRLANALQNLGVKPGDRVAALQVNCNEYIETYFATAKVGAIFVPLNYRAKAHELSFMLCSSESSALFIGERYAPIIESIRKDLPDIKHYVSLESPHDGMLNYREMLSSASPDEVDVEVGDDECTILMYTAGTTGFPKGVMLSHNSFTLYVLENVSPADPESTDANLLVVPLYHVAGIQGMMSSIYGGRKLVLQRQFEAKAWLEAVQQEKITQSVLVPTMVKQIIDHPDFSSYDLSSLRQVTYGAASMPLEVIKKAIQVLPKVRFINAFGQTETASTVTALGPEDHVIEGTEEEKEKKLKRLAMSIGKALPDVEVKVFDENGSELPPGEIGEIVARGPRIMSGYWKQPEATAATVRDGWVYTGDIGWMDEDGYFYLSGRAKDIIIRGGENISPEEVENVVHAHPAVEEAAVVGIPDTEWGESVIAVCVLKQDHQCSSEEIIEFCRQRLASFKKPERVEFIDALPRNPMGKVLRKALREKYGGQES